MPLDPEIEARVSSITGTTPDSAHALAQRVARVAAIGLRSPAFDLAPVAIYAVDLAGSVQAWNHASERLFGWTAEEAIGQPIPFLADVQIEGAIDGLAALVDGGTFADIELSPVRKDGTTIHVVTSASLINDEDGEPAMILAFALDVTERENARRELADTEHRWRKLLENVSDTVTVLNREGTVLESSGEFTDVLGYDFQHWEGARGFDLIHPDERPRVVERFGQLLTHPGVEYRDVYRTRHRSGHYELVEYTAVNLLDDPAVEGVVVCSRNVTVVKQAEALLADEADILELIAQDADLSETLPAISRMVEYHSGGFSGILLLTDDRQHVTIGSPGSIPEPVLKEIERTALDPTSGPCAASIESGQPVIIDDFAGNRVREDERLVLEHHDIRSGWASPIVENRTDAVIGTIVVYQPVPREPSDHERNVVAVASHLAAIALDRDRAQRELLYQARHHQLTGLPNRHSIIEMLDNALARTRNNHAKLGVMFIDLDRFKVVNDSLGHAAGDQLLIRFGERLKNLVRPTDYVGHFGADEFVVVLENIMGVDDVRFVANRLDLALSEPFAIEDGEGAEIFLSASIGVAVSEGHDDASDTLLQHADAAMYQAKAMGRDRLEVYDDQMRTRATEQLRLDRELRQAVERSELALFYQPEIDLTNGRIIGAEALLRWHHPDLGVVMPVDFIPVAEDTGLIVRIGRWVLEEAVLQARTWVDRIPGLEDFTVAVNLSARQITAPDLVGNVARVLERYNWPPAQLALELTESILIDDAEATLQVLRELKALGVKLAIDDFGTGFSSLSYLHRFPVDVVKVDRTFVTSIDASGDGSPVATAVMHMSRALGLLTAAEGVEEPEQLAGLRVLGCDIAQGFLFAEPLPSEQAEAMLRAAPAW